MGVMENPVRPDVAADAAAVLAVLAEIARAHHARDAAAIGRYYAPDAVIADLAPPLRRHGFDAGETQAWLDGWDGPVELRAHDLDVVVEGDLALVHGLLFTRAERGGEVASWWCRTTVALARRAEGWRIVHEHSSVPFHMDGSFRAAVDLQP